jgi:hypothetical protein
MSVEQLQTDQALYADQAEHLNGRAEILADPLVKKLISAGELTESVISDGTLGRFAHDETPGSTRGAVEHILVGDEQGGLHHARSVVNGGIEGRSVSSQVDGSRKLKEYRRRQRVKPNGTYHANTVEIEGNTGTFVKARGSAMFPDDWSSEDVLRKIVEVADGAPGKLTDRGTLLHEGFVASGIEKPGEEPTFVKVRALTDPSTGKILTAHPVKEGMVTW